MNSGGLLLGFSGALTEINVTAAGILRQDRRGPDGGLAGERGLAELLGQAGVALPIIRESWAIVASPGGTPLVLHAIPLAGDDPDAAAVVVLVDLRRNPRPSVSTLQKLFDLTPAEARLAVEIASGQTLSEISQRGGVSNATLRTQLSSLFTKTETRRQAELAVLLTRVAMFP
ncbi:helix-turn-helix transcriptional regulator [Methylobacterium sp. NEAU 140]|uniref:helix-turn-helix transcriptional regulator n=1 Tax=Methylobacterium sp. NEAU 140 TaxID=3064945 RepID=UPI0027353438|nr:helix-turn-helix transcriptional regulator [Methylobacterium sp. NEAU 140]MDP4023761.1 helix-turn-helix transcriptional regulator [Methylobacterium sp. NEAU 140]